MGSAKKLMRGFDWLIAFLLIFGVAVYAIGWSLNALVLTVNHWSMPICGEPDVLVNTDVKKRHYAKEGSAELLFLADCIRIDFPKIPIRRSKLLKPYYAFAVWLDYPLEGGPNMFSVGDLMRWVGAGLFLLMIPLILLRIPFRLARDGMAYDPNARKK